MKSRVVTMGELMLRLWVGAGERIESAPAFNVTPAGAEANTAVALARMGIPTSFVSRLPDNPLGRRAARTLMAQGVDVSPVVWEPEGRMGMFYVELSAPPRPVTVVYDRAGSSASHLNAEDIGDHLLRDVEVAYVSGITPALSPSCRDATEHFMASARSAGATVVFDINYRSKLWDPERAAAVLAALASQADALVVSEDDAAELFDARGEAAAVLEAMAEMTGVQQVVLTRGADGAAWMDGGAAGAVAPIDTQVLDPIGAGDAFSAGVIAGLLEGDLPGGVRRGAAMGAVEVGLYGDMLTVDPEEIDAVLDGAGRDVAR